MSGEVRIAEEAWAAVARHARDAWPVECCGLLVGTGADVLASERARNISDDPARRFLIDPRDHFSAVRLARSRGLSVVGAYHSHPRSEPRPSPTDLEEAFDDASFLHLIVGFGRGSPGEREPAFAAFSYSAGNFVALRLVRIP